MAEAVTKLPVKTEAAPAGRRALSTWRPFEGLRSEIDRLFEDFSRGFPRLPFGSRLSDLEPTFRFETSLGMAAPAIDVTESETSYDITVELPGMDEKNVTLTVADDMLTIEGEKKEEKEEKARDYYLSERRFGSFKRSFQLPDGVDRDKIEAVFQKGVLTLTLPKRPEAQKKAQKIAIKAK